MRTALALMVLVGCDVGHEDEALRVEPAAIDLTVELGDAPRAVLQVTAAGADVSADASYALVGAPLGATSADGFVSDGRTGGRATLEVRYRDALVQVPVHVLIHAARGDGAEAFGAATQVAVDAQLEPGDGALLPPNLGALDIRFATPAGDDTHEIALTAPDLDLHVFGGEPSVALTPAEWDAVVRTTRGGTVDLALRTTTRLAPGLIHVETAKLAVADLPFADEVLFTGKRAADPVSQVWSYALARGTTEPWANGPNGACLGCHLAISRDGRRFAAGTSTGGTIVDVATRYEMAPPSAQIGVWQSAAFADDGTLVTAQAGVLTVRDGTTALPIASYTPESPAAQPAVRSHHLVYAAGPLDTVQSNPTNVDLRIHAWPPVNGQLAPAQILVPAQPGVAYKLPDLSPDERWVMFSQVPTLFRVMGDVSIVPADGGDVQVLARGFDMARFASALEASRAGTGDFEPMVWIVMKSERSVGGRDQTGVPQLWAMAFFPERGVASRPFYLPGQAADIIVAHAPTAIRVP